MALIALVALVVVFIIGLGLLTLGSNARLSGKRAMRLNGAQAMTSAGIEYGDWQAIFNNQPLPYTGSRSLGNGNFTVVVTDNSANLAGTLKIVSTGTQSGNSASLTRILPTKKTVFDYALCSGSDLNIGQTVTTGSGSANGDISANGIISLIQSGTVVNGDAIAAGNSINISSITGKKAPQRASSTFPAINTTYYQSIAHRTFTGASFSMSTNFVFQTANEVVYINGSLVIPTGTISGTGTIIVTGTITINGNRSYVSSSDKAAFLTLTGVVDGAAAGTSLSTVGFFYAHNSTNNATLQMTNSGSFTLTGSMAADSFTNINGSLSISHDPAMNTALGKQLFLPGY